MINYKKKNGSMKPSTPGSVLIVAIMSMQFGMTGQASEAYIPVWFNGELPGWPGHVLELVDMEDDGQIEVLVSSNDSERAIPHVKVFDSTITTTLCSHSLGSEIEALAVGQFDTDATLEIFAATEYRLTVIDYPSCVRLYHGGVQYLNPTFGDFDDDGFLDIAHTRNNDLNVESIANDSLSVVKAGFGGILASGKIDSTPGDDIVSAKNQRIFVLSGGSFSNIWQFHETAAAAIIGLVDFFGSGEHQIVVSDGGYNVTGLDPSNGSTLFTYQTQDSVRSLRSGDHNNDQQQSLLVISRYEVNVVEHDGTSPDGTIVVSGQMTNAVVSGPDEVLYTKENEIGVSDARVLGGNTSLKHSETTPVRVTKINPMDDQWPLFAVTYEGYEKVEIWGFDENGQKSLILARPWSYISDPVLVNIDSDQGLEVCTAMQQGDGTMARVVCVDPANGLIDVDLATSLQFPLTVAMPDTATNGTHFALSTTNTLQLYDLDGLVWSQSLDGPAYQIIAWADRYYVINHGQWGRFSEVATIRQVDGTILSPYQSTTISTITKPGPDSPLDDASAYAGTTNGSTVVIDLSDLSTTRVLNGSGASSVLRVAIDPTERTLTTLIRSHLAFEYRELTTRISDLKYGGELWFEYLNSSGMAMADDETVYLVSPHGIHARTSDRLLYSTFEVVH